MMPLSKTARRRWLGALALGLALVMLLAGETVLKGRLAPVVMLVYWLVCVLLTLVAAVIALADLRATRSEIRGQEHELLEQTLKQIEAEVRNRKRRG